jgi:chromosome segregation ATPase
LAQTPATGQPRGAIVQQAFFLAIILALAALSGWLWHRERATRLRAAALRQLLDGADALEARLQDYRARMTRLKGLLHQLPSDMTASAMLRVDTEAQVQSALRDVLAHRLWIKRESGSASQQVLDEAVRAIERTGDQLAARLRQLDEVSEQLQAAGAGLRSAYQEASAALAAQRREPGTSGEPVGGEPPTPTRH